MHLKLENIKGSSLATATDTFQFTRLFLGSFLIAALSACGSGGGSGDDGDEELLFLGAGDSISGSLTSDELVTFRVPADSHVILSSDTGDSDLFLYETPEFIDEARVCADRSVFKEDICSGNGFGDFLYATVNSHESGDYTLSVTNDCSVDNINQWVYRSMQDYYLFADQVPAVNPLDYDSPSDLVNDLRFNELEPFSGIRDAVASQALFEEGKDFGFGYIWARDSEDDLRILNVDTDSPFGRADVKRGDIFRSFGGISEEELTDGQFVSLIGTDDDPKRVEWTFEDGETGELKTFAAAKAEYSVNTVAFTSSYPNAALGGRTGYIVLNRFLNTSVGELNEAIEELAEDNITELVLDLRYNGGGRVIVAERLAAQLSGNLLAGQVLIRSQHNDTYRHLDSERPFAPVSPALDLSRVIVITSANTASSSEIVINALKPYMDVVTIGERSVGKPFISDSREFCGLSLNAMHSQHVNASEVSVAGGIEATCFAEDDSARDYGIRETGIEGMLESALDYIESGDCDLLPPATVASRSSLQHKMQNWEKTGEIEVLGSLQNSKPQPFDPR